jgi:hypothetical protein
LFYLGNKLLWNANLVVKDNKFYLYNASLIECAIVAVICIPATVMYFFLVKVLRIEAPLWKVITSIGIFSIVVLYFLTTSSYGKGTLSLYVIKNIIVVFITALFLVFLDSRFPISQNLKKL